MFPTIDTSEIRWAERGLLVANGAIFLTLLGLIGTTWSGQGYTTDLTILSSIILELDLRNRLLQGMMFFGLAFYSAGSASILRLVKVGGKHAHLQWSIMMVVSAGLMFYGGHTLINELLGLTGDQIDTIEELLEKS